MIALERKERESSEASIKCLDKGLPCSLQAESSPENKNQTISQVVSEILKQNRSLNKELKDNSNEPRKKMGNGHDFGHWSPFHPSQKTQMKASVSPFYHPVDNRFQYAPFPMPPQGYSNDFQIQDFHYFVVIDFEATCDKEKIPHPQEIIEFPSVIVSSMTGQLEASFQTYVKPTCNELLTDFCKDLTGIQQTQVDKGVSLSEALLRHDKWLESKGIKNSNFAVVTWSNWDCRVMLESECRFKNIRKPAYFNRWINLKVPFQELFGGLRCNLKEAVQQAGLTWQGRAHCGLDDATNTARLLALMMHRGFKFSFTNSLTWQAADYPVTLNHHQSHSSSTVHHHHPNNHPKYLNIPMYPFYPCYCFCGTKSINVVNLSPGPEYGGQFLVCGNWTPGGGSLCPFRIPV